MAAPPTWSLDFSFMAGWHFACAFQKTELHQFCSSRIILQNPGLSHETPLPMSQKTVRSDLGPTCQELHRWPFTSGRSFLPLPPNPMRELQKAQREPSRSAPLPGGSLAEVSGERGTWTQIASRFLSGQNSELREHSVLQWITLFEPTGSSRWVVAADSPKSEEKVGGTCPAIRCDEPGLASTSSSFSLTFRRRKKTHVACKNDTTTFDLLKSNVFENHVGEGVLLNTSHGHVEYVAWIMRRTSPKWMF